MQAEHPKDVLRECPRCYARVSADRMAGHVDWHTGVRDGFHPYQPGGPDHTGVSECRAEMRNSRGGVFWFCNLPADHPYHQPLPEPEGNANAG